MSFFFVFKLVEQLVYLIFQPGFSKAKETILNLHNYIKQKYVVAQ